MTPTTDRERFDRLLEAHAAALPLYEVLQRARIEERVREHAYFVCHMLTALSRDEQHKVIELLGRLVRPGLH